MSLQLLSEQLKDYARDIRLNLTSVLSEEGAPGLTSEQLWGVALACAYSTRQKELIQAIESDAAAKVSDAVREAAKAGAVIMAMNNVYYRFTHVVEDKSFAKMPARLRMNVIGKPGVAKVDFELICLAISAINGCSACVNAHIHEASKAGISPEGSQSTVRIAAVISGAAQALSIN